VAAATAATSARASVAVIAAFVIIITARS